MGKCARRYASFFGVLLALRRLDPEERSRAGGSVEVRRVTRHPWLVACDAIMSPVEIEKASGFRGSKSAKGEWIEKVYDYVIACTSLEGKISQMEVMEDFDQSSVLFG